MTASERPPRWAERILERLLTAEDRQIISGDLSEEYCDILPRIGRFRSDFWYVRQVASFVPRSANERGRGRRSLLLLSLCSAVCGCWLAAMEALLQHPGYLLHIAFDSLFFFAGVATVLVRLLHLGLRAERWLLVAAVGLMVMGCQAFVKGVRSSHFEGFVLLISMVLVVHGASMLLSLGRFPEAPQRTLDETGVQE